MLTYASVNDFLSMKDVGKSGTIVVPEASKTKVATYLERATRYIRRYTRRDFIPWVETRRYPIPYRFNDLSIRHSPTAHLHVDNDLLEALIVNNGSEDIDDEYYFLIEHNVKPHHGIAIKYPKYWGNAYGGITGIKRYNEAVISITGMWGYTDALYPSEAWINTNAVIPPAGLNASSTSFTIATADPVDADGKLSFTKGNLLRVDNELMAITDVATGGVITVKRGARGSTAAIHAAGAIIQRWNVIEDIVEATLQIAKTWREADVSAGSRIGVSDVSVGAELTIPSDPLKILDSYQRSLLLEQ